MHRFIFLIPLCFITFFSCREKTPATSENTEASSNGNNFIQYKKLIIGCEMQDKNYWDTLFLKDLHFKMSGLCQNDFYRIDTALVENNTALITMYRDYAFVVQCDLYPKDIIIRKKNYSKLLAPDLVGKGIFGEPTQIVFNPADSSVTFKTFIGLPESDVGDFYTLKIFANGNTEVTDVEMLNLGEEE